MSSNSEIPSAASAAPFAASAAPVDGSVSASYVAATPAVAPHTRGGKKDKKPPADLPKNPEVEHMEFIDELFKKLERQIAFKTGVIMSSDKISELLLKYIALIVKALKESGYTGGIDETMSSPLKFKPKDPVVELAKFLTRLDSFETDEQKMEFIKASIGPKLPGKFCVATFPKFFPERPINNYMYNVFLERINENTFVMTAQRNPNADERTRDAFVDTKPVGENIMIIKCVVRHKINEATIKNELLHYAVIAIVNSHINTKHIELTMQADTHATRALSFNPDEMTLEEYLKARSHQMVGTVRTDCHGNVFASLFEVAGQDSGCGIAMIPLVIDKDHLNWNTMTPKQRALWKFRILAACRRAIPRASGSKTENLGKCKDVPNRIRQLDSFWDLANKHGGCDYFNNMILCSKFADLLKSMSCIVPIEEGVEPINAYQLVVDAVSSRKDFKIVEPYTKEEMCMLYCIFPLGGTPGGSGNHFVDFIYSLKSGRLSVAVHTGCRGWGHKLIELLKRILVTYGNGHIYAEGLFADFAAKIGEFLVKFAQINRMIIMANVIEEIQGSPINFVEIFKNAEPEEGMTRAHLANMMIGMVHNETVYYANDQTQQICQIEKKGATIQDENDVAIIAGGTRSPAILSAFRKHNPSTKIEWIKISSDDYQSKLSQGYIPVLHTETTLYSGPHGTGREATARDTQKKNTDPIIPGVQRDFTLEFIKKEINHECAYNSAPGHLSDHNGYRDPETIIKHLLDHGMTDYITYELVVNFKEANADFNLFCQMGRQQTSRLYPLFKSFSDHIDKYWIPLRNHLKPMTVDEIDQFMDSDLFAIEDLVLSGKHWLKYFYMIDVVQRSATYPGDSYKICDEEIMQPFNEIHQKIDQMSNRYIQPRGCQ